ncbi:hypothetical protein NM208_g15645 [Fusarium decemcellulare]|uniref:Uncharacterized protein n=1 Tax=Fusarium decemcellulare TaxID=57161 RepID=A0ACC1RFV0_9HYPO|nr:hypothetical protein NM208_g15645 [Fusarium decemcellulare]
MFMLPAEEIDKSQGLAKYGVDSLVAVELRTWLSSRIQTEISIFDMLQSASLIAVAEKAAIRSKVVINAGLSVKSAPVRTPVPGFRNLCTPGSSALIAVSQHVRSTYHRYVPSITWLWLKLEFRRSNAATYTIHSLTSILSLSLRLATHQRPLARLTSADAPPRPYAMPTPKATGGSRMSSGTRKPRTANRDDIYDDDNGDASSLGQSNVPPDIDMSDTSDRKVKVANRIREIVVLKHVTTNADTPEARRQKTDEVKDWLRQSATRRTRKGTQVLVSHADIDALSHQTHFDFDHDDNTNDVGQDRTFPSDTAG